MKFANAPYDKETIAFMTAALDLAWTAAILEVPFLTPIARSDMAHAILNAYAGGERDFRLLQRHALDALAPHGVRSAEPVDRRHKIRLVYKAD